MINRNVRLGDPPSIDITVLDRSRTHSDNGDSTPSARRSIAERPSGEAGYMWSTARSFAFFAVLIILALILAEVLKSILDVNAG